MRHMSRSIIHPRHNRGARTRGHSIAEVPAGLWLIFCGIFFPLLVLGTLSYRACLAYNALRDATAKAARANTYSEASTTGIATYNDHLLSITGVTGTYKLEVVRKALAAGGITVYSGALSPTQVTPATHIYFVRGNVTQQIEPLVYFTLPFSNVTVPGLTAPYPLNATQDVYFENPNGLTQ